MNSLLDTLSVQGFERYATLNGFDYFRWTKSRNDALTRFELRHGMEHTLIGVITGAYYGIPNDSVNKESSEFILEMKKAMASDWRISIDLEKTAWEVFWMFDTTKEAIFQNPNWMIFGSNDAGAYYAKHTSHPPCVAEMWEREDALEVLIKGGEYKQAKELLVRR